LIAASLGNDLYSYEKEYEDTMRAGLPDVVNAVWVIMGEHGCTEQEAKEICKERIRVENANYVKICEETKKRTDLCDDVRRYIDVMQYSLSGNLVWSIQCPRYNKGVQFGELQILRAKHGLEKYPALWPPKEGTDAKPAVDLAVKEISIEDEPAEDAEGMYWGLNGVGIRVGHGVDAHGVGTYNSGEANGHSNGVETNGQSNGVEANAPSNGIKTNGANGTNGVKTSSHSSKPSTDSLTLDSVVSLALTKDLPDLGDAVSLIYSIYHRHHPFNS
jgi:ophiobolin F synthase